MSWSADLAAELGRRVRGKVGSDAMTRALYSTDASIYRAMPLAVVLPRDDDDVRATVELAAEHSVPLLPRGGGTSLEGQTVNEALVMDCSAHLDRVLEVNVEESWARVQPGVIQDGLSRQVAGHGLKFGPDTATGSRATLGGMIGNNSAGTRSIVHGKTIDHVLEVRCLLADGSEAVFGELDRDAFQAKQRLDGIEGRIYRVVAAAIERRGDEILRRYPKIMRHVCGYSLDYLVKALSSPDGRVNMAHLLVGSEGTLATVLEAKVRLVPRPRATALGVVQFDDLVECMEAARQIVPTGPSAVELIDRLIVGQARNHPTLTRMCGFVEGDPGAVLITEYSGDDQHEAEERVDALRRLLARENLGYGFHPATTAVQQNEVWQVRKSGLSLMMALEGDPKPIAFVEDSAVDVDRLPEYVQRLQQVVADHGTWAGFYGHASVGCLHFRPVINCKDAGDIAKLRAIAEDIRDLVVEFDGSLSGEHGDGRTRTEFLPGFYGSSIYDAFREIKTAFDPEGRMNPGNICDPFAAAGASDRALERPDGVSEPLAHGPYVIDQALRYGADYTAHDVERYLDWSKEGGLAHHVEMCNGNGTCRKVDSGTMCPSYMATRDEEHSTRGRANALRTVISGAVPEEAFTSRRLYQVLDLCLECKGCKGECPSNVDMAKLKYEFLAQFYDAHGTPLRARIFGGVARLSEWGSRLAPLSNWIGGARPTRWLNERLLGISRRRPIPPFSRQTFEAWFYGRAAAGGPSPGDRPRRRAAGDPTTARRGRGEVVLFHDTFMNHNYPDIGRAAVRVLEAAGFEVLLSNRVCCGRPLLSNGLVDQAREHARINVERLAGFARRGSPLVACEPSCLSMLREDYLDLLPNSDGARAIAESSFLIEELLVRSAKQEAASSKTSGSGPLHDEGSSTGRGDAGEASGPAAAPPLGLRFESRRRRLLVHGHCHQKASVGLGSTLQMLGWVPGYELDPLDSGCCGMAGSFGYKAEHYDLSMAIGERVLLPRVRADTEAGVVVSGISCRQQVLHATGRVALHPVEWLARALVDR